MASKKEIFESTLSAVAELCSAHNTAEDFNSALTGILTTNLAPKSGGATVNLEDVTRDGEVLCSVSNVWLPATIEFFYEDKSGKSLVKTEDGVAIKRLSRQAEAIRKQHIKTLVATEKAIMSDVLDGAMTPEDGKAQLETAKSNQPDYSSVSAELPSEDAE